jgi:uncharacterized protein with von Willebrand factor type A (vWA) domain
VTDAFIGRLVARLRARGVPISVAEVVDAHRCVAVVGWHDRGHACTALRAALIKHGLHDPVFDEELQALLEEVVETEELVTRAIDASASVAFDGVSADAPDRLPDDAERMVVEDEREGRSDDGTIQHADGPETGEQASVDGVDLADTGARATDDRRWHRIRPPARPSNEPTIDPADRREIERAARTFVRLHRHDARRWGRAPAGRLDVRATVRAARRTGAVPMELRRRGRVRMAPRIVVLADVSVSVRPTAVLALHTADALTRCRRGVRLLAFVDTSVDVSTVVRRSTPDAAVALLLDGGLIDLGAASDYGASLRSAAERLRAWVGPSTTVLVFGDGRSNGNDPGFEVIERWMRRSAGVHWCTPEPAGAWPLGFGEMQGYAERSTSTRQVRTVDDVVEALTDQRSDTARR